MLNFEFEENHNIMNPMAANISARLYDLRKDIIKESMEDFDNQEHRLEFVANIRGMEFINDSKATNICSTWYALESMYKPVIWIVGGQDKSIDYNYLKEVVALKVKAIVCLGPDNVRINKAFNKLVPTIVGSASLEDAVLKAYNLGCNDDVIILSPACASFDNHKNYEERGRRFKNAVREL